MPEKWPYFRTNRKGCRHEGSSFLKVAEEQVWFTGSPAARADLRDQQEESSLQGAPGIGQQIGGLGPTLWPADTPSMLGVATAGSGLSMR